MTITEDRPASDRYAPGPEPERDASEDMRFGFLRLAIAALLIAGFSYVLDIGGAVLVITAILGMIMLHEFGHFITARWAGMRVTDFFVGFGPTLWSVKRGDTRYGVKGLPVGGFVRVIGMNNLEEIAPEDEPYTYRSKTYWQRLRFAAAGSFMHFVIAFVMMASLLIFVGQFSPTTALSQVGEGTPAEAAGLRAGDKIVAVNGVTITDWDSVGTVIRPSEGKPVTLTLDRNGERITTTATPIDGRTPAEVKAGAEPRGIIGVGPEYINTKSSFFSGLWEAGPEVYNISKASAGALVHMFSKQGLSDYSDQFGKTGKADPVTEGNRLMSPVGIARVASSSADNGIASVLSLLIAINVFVAIFNLIPLPPFDGGHIAVATYEAIRGKITGRRHMTDMNKLLPVAYVVVLALFLMSASALWLDIVRPFNLG